MKIREIQGVKIEKAFTFAHRISKFLSFFLHYGTTHLSPQY